ncbi:MAG: GatB/YqeY domain-containing protein [Candidatus Staskawiczbacteria bacterium]|nr:GatB/YqeY domain-containing protein [Candidatus Staskawiczbacteria bacterium]
MLKKQIQQDSTEALKLGEQFRLGVLRMLLAAILTKEKDKRYKKKLQADAELTDEQILEVISSEIKKRKDAIVLYEQGKRPELAEREKKEIEVLKKYLPEQLSQEELKKLVVESITKVGAKEMKDTGKIMADLMPKVKGKAEGSEISKIIKELLTK